MFVKNKENIDFNFRKNGYLAILKANTVSYVDDSKVSAKELVACYGQRIDIISHKFEAAKKEAPKKEAEIIKKEDLNDSFIEKVLGEITGEISNTGDKEIDNFLNGESSKLPEGTEVITNEEAEKLKEKKITPAKPKTQKAPKTLKTQKAQKTRTGKSGKGKSKKA